MIWALFLSSQQTTNSQSFLSKEKEVKERQKSVRKSALIMLQFEYVSRVIACHFFRTLNIAFLVSLITHTAQNVSAVKSKQSLPIHIMCIPIILAQRQPRQWPRVCCSKPATQSNFTYSLCIFIFPQIVHFGRTELNSLRHHPAAILL